MRQLPPFHSIRQKLSVGMLITTLAALIISASILIAYDLRDYQKRAQENLLVQAELLKQIALPALQSGDNSLVNQSLSLFRVHPQFLIAAIYTAQNQLFSSYLSNPADANKLNVRHSSQPTQLSENHLALLHPVTLGTETIGYVYLEVQDSFYQRLWRDVVICFGVGLFALIISALLSGWMQSRITRPILALTNLARNITSDKDYYLKTDKTSNDETGYLTEVFNVLLDKIKRGTDELEHRNQQLDQQIKQRGLAEQSLSNSNLRHKTLLTLLSSIVWQADRKGMFLPEQQQWQNYTGQTTKQSTNLGWIQAFHPDDRVLITTLWQEAIDNAHALSIKLRLWHNQSQNYRHVHLHTIPILNEQNQLQEWIGIIDDIHDQVISSEATDHLNTELEQRVKQRTAELEHMNQELESFSYSVSHDLRAPLRSIDGFSQALLEDYQDKLDQQGMDYLQRVRAAAQRMGLLMDDLLKLSRVGRADIEISKLNLSEIAEKVVDDLKQQDDHTRQVNVHIEPEIYAYGDYQLLYLVLENLFSNAWKYTSKKELAEIVFGIGDSAGGDSHYFIKDNGAGFNMDYAGRLFGAFQRLHDASDFPGTGIGLATVQRIIHRHRGHIWAEAEIDNGATFYFTLPLHEEL